MCKIQNFLKNVVCVICGQCVHSNLAMRLKPFLTALTCWRIILRGREMDAELSHQRKQHYSSSIHSCLSLPLLEIWGYMIYFMLITDVAGEFIEFIASAEQKMWCILCMSIKEWPVLVLQRMEIGSQTPFVFQNRVSKHFVIFI